ncbi:MAG: precorrin-8X methylmutase [Desulfobacca sp.]|uniref:precorrin-8X methylmutase n=1 Tax=Desulfobacca sp. TaxID=2067990 RepID=UPI00404A135C
MTAALLPQEIEQESFRRIEAAVREHGFSPPQWAVVRRMIHAVADLELAELVRFHAEALPAGITALQERRPVFTDTRMLLAGVSRRLQRLAVPVTCLLDEPRVADLAQERGLTRSAAAVLLAAPQLPGSVVAIGNAPTALRQLLALLQAGMAPPALIIGLPVGFVDAAESKEALLAVTCPYITLVGPKGGSALAASALNALAILAEEEMSR